MNEEGAGVALPVIESIPHLQQRNSDDGGEQQGRVHLIL